MEPTAAATENAEMVKPGIRTRTLSLCAFCGSVSDSGSNGQAKSQNAEGTGGNRGAARREGPDSSFQILDWRSGRLVYVYGYKTQGRFSGPSACDPRR